MNDIMNELDRETDDWDKTMKAQDFTPAEKKRVILVYSGVFIAIIIYLIWWTQEPEKAIDFLTSAIGIIAAIFAVVIVIVVTLLPYMVLAKVAKEEYEEHKSYGRYYGPQYQQPHKRYEEKVCDSCRSYLSWDIQKQFWACTNCNKITKLEGDSYCRRCGSTNIKIYDDGSGICNNCNDTLIR